MRKSNSYPQLDSNGLIPVAYMGTVPTPVTRVNNPVVEANTPNANIDSLDAAIGPDSDLTAVIRTTGQLVANTTILKKIDMLDEGIGFDAQLSGTPKNISKNLTIYQNLEVLDAYKSVQTKKFTIGGVGIKAVGTITVSGTPVADETITIGETTYTFKAARAVAGEITINADNATQVTNIVDAVTTDSTDVVATDGADDTVVITAAAPGVAGNLLPFTESATGIAVDGTGTLGGTTAGVDPVAGCDFNFVQAANTTEQVINLGAIVPAFSRIIDVFTVTNSAFTGATTMGIEVGTSSGGNELIATANVIAANAINQIDHSTTYPTISASATNIYVSGTPGENWDNVTSGKLSIYITFNNVANI